MTTQMNCSKCAFAEWSVPDSGGPLGALQIGCQAGRLDVLKGLGKAEFIEQTMENEKAIGGYYKINQFCNMYRNQLWFDAVTEEDLKSYGFSNRVEAARNQSMNSFGIIVSIENEKELKDILNNFKDIPYPYEKIAIILSAVSKYQGVGSEIEIEKMVNTVEELKSRGFYSKFVLHTVDLKMVNEKNTFSEVMSLNYNFFIKMKSSQKISSGFLPFIEDGVNSKLSTDVFYEDCKNDIVALPRGIINSSYLNFLDYDVMVDELRKTSRDQGKYKTYEEK